MSVTNFRRASLKGGLPKSSEFADIPFVSSTIQPVLTSLLYLLDASSTTSYPGSGSTWYDISGQANNATLVGSVYTTASGAPSIIFDGVNDYATFGAGGVPTPTLPITFNFWFKSIAASPAQPTGMFDSSPGSANVLRQINGIAYGGVVNYPTVEWSAQNPTITLSEASGSYTATNWNQYTFVYNYATNRSIKWYQNATLIRTITGNTTSTLSWNELVIGAINKNDYWLNGYINNASLYSVELTAAQILQNYNAYSPRFI